MCKNISKKLIFLSQTQYVGKIILITMSRNLIPTPRELRIIADKHDQQRRKKQGEYHLTFVDQDFVRAKILSSNPRKERLIIHNTISNYGRRIYKQIFRLYNNDELKAAHRHHKDNFVDIDGNKRSCELSDFAFTLVAGLNYLLNDKGYVAYLPENPDNMSSCITPMRI